MERIEDLPPSANPTLVPVAQMDLMVSELSGGGGGVDTPDSVKQEEASGLNHPAEILEAMKWTNEKHSQYLKSMEASFVDQLHDSLDLLGWNSQKYASSQLEPCRQNHISKQDHSGEFKVFQEGWWSKIHFSRGEAELKKEDESEQNSLNPDKQTAQISSNSWIQRYKSGCRQQTRTPPTFQAKGFLADMKDELPGSGFHVCRWDSSGSNTGNSSISLEGTDQNFIDEDAKEDRECGEQSSKRMKSAAFANYDQIVPSGKFSYTRDVGEGHLFPKG